MIEYPGAKKVSSAPIPFPSIVGQEECKRVLLTLVANDNLSGALLVGEKGTAKSTMVRALVDLLPERRVVADCPYGCPPDDPETQCAACRERDHEVLPVETRPTPLVTLPLGATRDRVVGTLSVEDALAGEAAFDPGLLARANRGILYVDEVNLLEDHLVDVLLDVAASGTNVVERDGISVSHPADVTLIGTMNPEEGDLRPQLRDRFDLQATVTGCTDIGDRIEIIERALERDRAEYDRRGSRGDVDEGEDEDDDLEHLRSQLSRARERLPTIELPRERKTDIAALCLEAGVDGHRGDIAIARTATTIAALEGRDRVTEADVREAARYALPHRLRRTPFEESPDLEDVLDDRFDSSDGDRSDDQSDEDDTRDGYEGDSSADHDASDDAREPSSESNSNSNDDGSDRSSEPGGGSPSSSSRKRTVGSVAESDGNGRRHRAERPESEPTSARENAATGDDSNGDDRTDHDDETDDTDTQPVIPGGKREPAAVGTATAPSIDALEDVDSTDVDGQSGRTRVARATTRGPGARVRTEPADDDDPIDAAASIRAAASCGRSSPEAGDLRRAVRTTSHSATVVFAVDASASMRSAMRAAKGVVLECLRERYQRRDDVSFVAFAGLDAEVLLPPTTSVSLAARHLKDLPTGDRTPLPAGLETARQVLERTETAVGVVVLVTDGRANAIGSGGDGSGSGEGVSPTNATRLAARALASSDACSHVLIVDAGEGGRASLTDLVAAETGGTVVPLSELTLETVRTAVGNAITDAESAATD